MYEGLTKEQRAKVKSQLEELLSAFTTDEGELLLTVKPETERAVRTVLTLFEKKMELDRVTAVKDAEEAALEALQVEHARLVKRLKRAESEARGLKEENLVLLKALHAYTGK